MSLTLKNLDPGGVKSTAPAIDAALLQVVIDAANMTADSVVNRTRDSVKAMLNDALAKVEARLASIEAPQAQVMAVEIGGAITHLKSEAVPFLGRMIMNAKRGRNTLLVGPAGCGKTFAAGQLAEAMGLEFGHVCCTAGMSETWVFGRQTPNGFVEAPFARMYRDGGVFLFDELDAADANMLLALNTALANGHLFNPISGVTSKRNANFVCVAGANTVGKGGDHVYTGRNRLDAASLRRWIKIAVDYSTSVEKMLCPDKTLRDLLTNARTTLREMGSDEIISSGCMEQAYEMLIDGQDKNDILSSITLGWPTEVIKKCGLHEYPAEFKPVTSEVQKTSDSYPAVIGETASAETAKFVANEKRIAELKRKLAERGGK